MIACLCGRRLGTQENFTHLEFQYRIQESESCKIISEVNPESHGNLWLPKKVPTHLWLVQMELLLRLSYRMGVLSWGASRCRSAVIFSLAQFSLSEVCFVSNLFALEMYSNSSVKQHFPVCRREGSLLHGHSQPHSCRLQCHFPTVRPVLPAPEVSHSPFYPGHFYFFIPNVLSFNVRWVVGFEWTSIWKHPQIQCSQGMKRVAIGKTTPHRRVGTVEQCKFSLTYQLLLPQSGCSTHTRCTHAQSMHACGGTDRPGNLSATFTISIQHLPLKQPFLFLFESGQPPFPLKGGDLWGLYWNSSAVLKRNGISVEWNARRKPVGRGRGRGFCLIKTLLLFCGKSSTQTFILLKTRQIVKYSCLHR